MLEYEFVLTDIQFKIIDVGGKREERVRWIDFLAVGKRYSQSKIFSSNFCSKKSPVLFFLEPLMSMIQILLRRTERLVKICRTTANKIDATQEKNRLKESIELFKRIQQFFRYFVRPSAYCMF